MAFTTEQEEILEKVIEAYENGKRLTDLPDAGEVDPSTLWTEVVGDDGESKKTRLSTFLPYVEDDVAYGIRRNVDDSDPTCTRIGNMDLHRTLPVQSAMRGCLLDDDGNVVQYLPDDDWTGATLDGSKGQVMVEIPMHYRKCQFYDDGTMEVWLSYYPLADYELIPKMYVGAYQATVQRSVNKLCSVANSDADYRGGNNTADYDDTYASQLGKPAGQLSANNSRTYARNRGSAGKNGAGWNGYLYEAHKAITWLFVVEYATLNSQANYNEELTSEGYHQGGLSAGVTNLNQYRWYSLMKSGYYPFLDCGYTDEFGNRSGVKVYTMPFEYQAGDSSSTSGITYYVGEYDSSTAYSTGDYVSEGELLYQCIADAPAGTPLTDTTYFSSVTRTTTNVNRYRGIEIPFGQIRMWATDILVDVHAEVADGGDGLSPIYVCKDPSLFSGTTYENYSYIGNHIREAGYITRIIFGSSGEIMGTAIGGSSSTYYCDQQSTSLSSPSLRGVFIGGHAYIGSQTGLFSAYSYYAPSNTSSNYGSRLCFIPA